MLLYFVLTALVPYFGHVGPSYASYPVMREAYSSFDVEITFKPETPDGLSVFIHLIFNYLKI